VGATDVIFRLGHERCIDKYLTCLSGNSPFFFYRNPKTNSIYGNPVQPSGAKYVTAASDAKSRDVHST